MGGTIGFTRRKLPHWTVAEQCYFVTIRLKGSLPCGVTRELREERESLRELGVESAEMKGLLKRQFQRVEAILDVAAREGVPNLNETSVGRVLHRSLDWMQTQLGWSVYAATVMPTHVHLVTRNLAGRNGNLAEDMGRMKRFTAREINGLLGLEGQLWQSENFDHWCRDHWQFDKFCAYVLQNPVKAGLAARPGDWPWNIDNRDDMQAQ